MTRLLACLPLFLYLFCSPVLLVAQTGEVLLPFEINNGGSIDTLSDGRIIVASSNTATVACFSPSLELLWSYTAPGEAEYLGETNGMVSVTADDDIYWGLQNYVGASFHVFSLFKLSGDGQFLWHENLSGRYLLDLLTGPAGEAVFISAREDFPDQIYLHFVSADGESVRQRNLPTAYFDYITAWFGEDRLYLIYSVQESLTEHELYRASWELGSLDLDWMPIQVPGFEILTTTSLSHREFIGRTLEDRHRLLIQYGDLLSIADFSTIDGALMSLSQWNLPAAEKIARVLPRKTDSSWILPLNYYIAETGPGPSQSLYRGVRTLPLNPVAPLLDQDVKLLPFTDNVTFQEGFPYRGGFVSNAAFSQLSIDRPNYLSRLDENGCLPFGQLAGRVALADEELCETGEVGMNNWLVRVGNEAGQLLTTTDENGQFSFSLRPGRYAIEVVPPNDLWGFDCPIPDSIEVSGDSLSELSLPVNILTACADLEVNMSTPFLRRCFPAIYTIDYANYGTITADGVFIEATLDSSLLFTGSVPEPDSISGQQYWYQLGDLPIGANGSIAMNVTVACGDTTLLGQTHCSMARILPVDSCGAEGLNYANVVVNGACLGDSVLFTIQNVGNLPTGGPLQYVIIEDQVILIEDEFSLEAGAMQQVTVPVSGGTFTLLAEQDASFPFPSFPQAYVEACGNGTDFSLGFGNQFPLDDATPAVDIDCQQNIGAFDPNDKIAFPNGVGELHYIAPGTSITYHIRFQNTGTDTAFTVVIRDTLGLELDLSTFRLLGSSHPVTLDNGVDRELVFTFNNIMLPDSNTNWAGSNGYVRFSIEHEETLPLGSVIQNRAGIYFDFNEPVLTPYFVHTLGEDYMATNLFPRVFPTIELLSIFPTPANSQLTITLPVAEPDIASLGQLQIFDSLGRLVIAQPFMRGSATLDVSGLAKGIYYCQVELNTGGIWRGKLLVGG